MTPPRRLPADTAFDTSNPFFQGPPAPMATKFPGFNFLHNTDKEEEDRRNDEDILRDQVERANAKLDAQDEDFTPSKESKLKRKTDVAEATPSKKAKQLDQDGSARSSKTKAKVNPFTSFAKYNEDSKARRIKLVDSISSVWGGEPAHWPVHQYCPKKASAQGRKDEEPHNPFDWGAPILEQVWKLADISKNDRDVVLQTLRETIRDRKDKVGGKDFMTTDDLKVTIDTILSKEPVRESRSPSVLLARPVSAEHAARRDSGHMTPVSESGQVDKDDVDEQSLAQITPKSKPLGEASFAAGFSKTTTPHKDNAPGEAFVNSVRDLDSGALRTVAGCLFNMADARERWEKERLREEQCLLSAWAKS